MEIPMMWPSEVYNLLSSRYLLIFLGYSLCQAIIEITLVKT